MGAPINITPVRDYSTVTAFCKSFFTGKAKNGRQARQCIDNGYIDRFVTSEESPKIDRSYKEKQGRQLGDNMSPSVPGKKVSVDEACKPVGKGFARCKQRGKTTVISVPLTRYIFVPK